MRKSLLFRQSESCKYWTWRSEIAQIPLSSMWGENDTASANPPPFLRCHFMSSEFANFWWLPSSPPLMTSFLTGSLVGAFGKGKAQTLSVSNFMRKSKKTRNIVEDKDLTNFFYQLKEWGNWWERQNEKAPKKLRCSSAGCTDRSCGQ